MSKIAINIALSKQPSPRGGELTVVWRRYDLGYTHYLLYRDDGPAIAIYLFKWDEWVHEIIESSNYK